MSQPNEKNGSTPLTDSEVHELGTFNAEVARGLIHTEEWRQRMAALQARFDAAGYESAERDRLFDRLFGGSHA